MTVKGQTGSIECLFTSGVSVKEMSSRSLSPREFITRAAIPETQKNVRRNQTEGSEKKGHRERERQREKEREGERGNIAQRTERQVKTRQKGKDGRRSRKR